MQLARKNRPIVFADLVGQPVPVKVLSNSIVNNTLHQAYLFTGQIGSGKTTAARILATSENCLVSPGLTPCGKCNICTKAHEGNHADINEIDAASSAGGVAEIRKLKMEASYNPIDGAKTKYFIIDECHRMSPEANDSLLKLLEEPPDRVRFVLCTTDIQKLRPAIQSRCQRHDFRKIYWTQIAERLEHVSKQEGIEYESSALQACARFADGSMRNALQNLEKLIAYTNGKKLLLSDAEVLFGSISESLYFALIDQIIGIDGTADVSEGYKIINQIVSKGTDSTVILQGIEEHLRNLMLVLTSSKGMDFIVLSQNSRQLLKQQKSKCQDKLEAIILAREELNEAKKSIEYNFSIEGALFTWMIKAIHCFRGG
jgi:DNA polymerase-3 subunit gamma/tau